MRTAGGQPASRPYVKQKERKTPMHASIWTYPWDVQDVGLETAMGEILDVAGADGISLAVSYHAGRFVQPRNPRRKVYFPEDGTIYFMPNLNRYGRIQPKVADIVRERGDVAKALADARERRPFRLNGWTVCLHNTRVGYAYPDVAVQNAFGDRYFHSLCPSQPDAREYVTAMVGDMSSRYRLDAVELETPTFMGFAHGYHHEKDELGLGAKEEFLLSLCFCPACIERARRAGVDAEAARQAVLLELGAAFERAVPAQASMPDGPDGFDPAVAAFLRWRTEPVTSLISEIREAAHPETRVHLLSGAPARAWQSGVDLAAAARQVDGLVVLAYDLDEAGVAERTAAGRALGSDGYLSMGLRLDAAAGAEGLRARMAAAARAGADGCNLYNFGLVPAARLGWVREAAVR
ncbi:MAG: hypothetical protein K0R39_4739 [Symbiobacteriaceae bacterium]|jgi:hypothetical protein|nr:hypothetical protein [Symbiobacteriaceae bacterium]